MRPRPLRAFAAAHAPNGCETQGGRPARANPPRRPADRSRAAASATVDRENVQAAYGREGARLHPKARAGLGHDRATAARPRQASPSKPARCSLSCSAHRRLAGSRGLVVLELPPSESTELPCDLVPGLPGERAVVL